MVSHSSWVTPFAAISSGRSALNVHLALSLMIHPMAPSGGLTLNKPSSLMLDVNMPLEQPMALAATDTAQAVVCVRWCTGKLLSQHGFSLNGYAIVVTRSIYIFSDLLFLFIVLVV